MLNLMVAVYLERFAYVIIIASCKFITNASQIQRIIIFCRIIGFVCLAVNASNHRFSATGSIMLNHLKNKIFLFGISKRNFGFCVR